MRLTTKGCFAAAAIIDLALCQKQGPITLAGINRRQKISLSYLKQLFGKLRRHEVVEGVCGPGDGHSLARCADDVTVADIIITVDEPSDATQYGGKGNRGDEEHVGGHTGRYMTYGPWAMLNQKMVEHLDSVSLQNLVDRQRERQPEVIRNMCEARPACRERAPTRIRAVDTPVITSVATELTKRAPLVNSVFSLARP